MKLYTSLLAMLVLMLSCSPRAHASDAYFTEEDAAHDALGDAYNCGEQVRECGGVIYRYENKDKVPYVLYFYSEPERGKAFGVTITALTTPAPRNMKIVADYHTHICSSRNHGLQQLFSFADTLTNQGFHTVGYMLDSCSGNIHRYDPAQDVADDVVIKFASGRELDLTEGHIVGWINVYRSVK